MVESTPFQSNSVGSSTGNSISSSTSASDSPITTTEVPRILIIDDEVAVLRLLKAILVRANYRVTICQGAEEALRLLSSGAQFDCLVTDAMMPAMSGYELVRAVRYHANTSDIPVIMLTRKSDRSDVKKAMIAGVNDYVLKPIDEYLLLDKISICLKNKITTAKLREVLVHGAEAHAQATLDFRLTAMRETGMTLRLPFEIPAEHIEEIVQRIASPIFPDIGIPIPFLRQVRSRRLSTEEVGALVDFPVEVEFSFIGVEESGYKKIRAWLQRQEILRKK